MHIPNIKTSNETNNLRPGKNQFINYLNEMIYSSFAWYIEYYIWSHSINANPNQSKNRKIDKINVLMSWTLQTVLTPIDPGISFSISIWRALLLVILNSNCFWIFKLFELKFEAVDVVVVAAVVVIAVVVVGYEARASVVLL